MPIKKLTAAYTSTFFPKLKVGEVFTYSQVFDLKSVKKIADAFGVTIEYCAPGSEEYKNFGCFACKVVAKDDSVDQPVNEVEKAVEKEMEKNEDSKYTMKVNEVQLRIILEALDLYSRLLCGQTSEAANFLRWHHLNSNQEIDHRAADSAGKQLKRAFWGDELGMGASYGIRSDKTPEEAKAAYDIIQVARYVRAWSKHPEGGIQVDFHTPWRCGKEEFITITRDE